MHASRRYGKQVVKFLLKRAAGLRVGGVRSSATSVELFRRGGSSGRRRRRRRQLKAAGPRRRPPAERRRAFPVVAQTSFNYVPGGAPLPTGASAVPGRMVCTRPSRRRAPLRLRPNPSVAVHLRRRQITVNKRLLVRPACRPTVADLQKLIHLRERMHYASNSPHRC